MPNTTGPSAPSTDVKLSRRWQWATRGRAISYLMEQAVENPNAISLAAGLVDPSTLPVEETRRVLADLLGDSERGCRALQYGTTSGSERLRRQVAQLIQRLEERSTSGHNGSSHAAPVEIDPSRLILTTGSQQLLSLVGEVLLDPDDICLVAAPTYFVFLGVIHGLGARAVPIPADENGMQLDQLEQELERIEAAGELGKAKLIYAVSYYENPSGISLSVDRRRDLVSLAERWSRDHKIFVLEDAAYRELHYDGPDRPSVWSFDPSHETVILAQTFSKSFSPGLRCGYGLLPKPLVRPIADRKGNEDFGSSNFVQHLIATVLERGLYEPHVEQVRASYRVKRDRMLAAAEKYFSDLPGVSWVRPEGGLYVWMTLPEQIQTGLDSQFFDRAVKVDGVMYVPGELCYGGTPTQRRRNQMRLSFGVESPDQIEEGMRRLSNAVRATL